MESKQIEELLDSKFTELKDANEELLDSKFTELKDANSVEVKALKEELNTVVTEKKTIADSNEEMKKSMADMKTTQEAIEKKLSTPAVGSESKENLDLKAYEKSFDVFLRKGIDVEQELAEKGVTAMFGEKHENINVGGNNGFILNTKENKTMRVAVDIDGGYLVRPEMSTTPEKRIFESTPMRSLASVQTIGSDAYEIIIDDDEAASGGWVDEEGTRAITDTPQIGKLSIPTHEQFAQPKITQKMLDDAVIDVGAWLQEKTNDIISRTENTAFVSGDGSKKPQGFLHLSAWTTQGTYERGKLEHIISGVNGTSAGLGLVADKIIETQASLLEEHQEGAVWMMNRMTWAQVKKLKTGTGEYLLDRDLFKTDTSPVLLGKPVVFSNDMAKPSAFTTGTLAIAYGNFRVGYQIVDRLGIRVLRDPLTAKPYILFYTTKRVGGDVKNFQAIKINKLSA